MLSTVLMEISLLLIIAGFLMILDVIKISGWVRLKVGFVMLASMVIMIIASLLAHIEFGLLKPMLGLWGIFAAGPFIGCC